MPSQTVMRARAKQLDKAISQSPSERKKARESKKKEEEEQSTVGPFVLGLLLFLTVGSAFLSVFQNIQNSPSMSDAP